MAFISSYLRHFCWLLLLALMSRYWRVRFVHEMITAWWHLSHCQVIVAPTQFSALLIVRSQYHSGDKKRSQQPFEWAARQRTTPNSLLRYVDTQTPPVREVEVNQFHVIVAFEFVLARRFHERHRCAWCTNYGAVVYLPYKSVRIFAAAAIFAFFTRVFCAGCSCKRIVSGYDNGVNQAQRAILNCRWRNTNEWGNAIELMRVISNALRKLLVIIEKQTKIKGKNIEKCLKISMVH